MRKTKINSNLKSTSRGMFDEYERTLRHMNRQVEKRMRQTPKYKRCIIKSLVPQGDNLFAIARYKDSFETLSDGTTVTITGGYVGNESNIPQEELTMTEILIDTDLNFSKFKTFDIESIIGTEAEVQLIDGIPICIHITPPNFNSRSPSRQDIQRARAVGQDNKRLGNKFSIEYLKSLGYSDKIIDSILDEKVTEIDPEGYILVYGDVADWIRTDLESASNNSSYKDISKFVDVDAVNGLPASKLKDKLCHRPPVMLSGF